jgi:SAM-dependent methyltransferase
LDRLIYEQHAALERDHWWFVSRREILRRLLSENLPPSADRRILDVGCGTGGMLPMLSHFGDVSGLDSDPEAVAACHERFPSYAVSRAEIPKDMPGDSSFDLVSAFDVIEHIADDLGAVRSLRDATRPGGQVVITVPAHAWLWSRHDVANGHHRRYGRSRLADLVGAAGLELSHLSSFNTALLPLIGAIRLSRRLRRQPSGTGSDFTMPPPRLNAALTRLMSAEAPLVARRGLPTGVSLVALARRPA